MRLRPSAALLSGALVLALAVPAQAAPLVVLDKGHVDVVDVEYANSAFELHVHDETVEPGVERDPSDVLFRALPKAKTSVPDDPNYSFLGTPGSPVWVLPQVQDADLLFPGLATEEVPTGVFVDDQVSLKLCAISGPGKASVFTTDAFGAPTVLLDSGDGLPDRTDLSVGGHQHANWAFTKAGTYRLTFSVSGQLASTGQTVTSGHADFTFRVLNS
jgi:surface-anchored protein